MSYIIQPDLHPGRCRNFRHDLGPYGNSRRCLEAEEVDHVCRFEQPGDEEINASWGRGSGSFTYRPPNPEPKPWIVPPK